MRTIASLRSWGGCTSSILSTFPRAITVDTVHGLRTPYLCEAHHGKYRISDSKRAGYDESLQGDRCMYEVCVIDKGGCDRELQMQSNDEVVLLIDRVENLNFVKSPIECLCDQSWFFCRNATLKMLIQKLSSIKGYQMLPAQTSRSPPLTKQRRLLVNLKKRKSWYVDYVDPS